jgi:hypothetical protein
MCSHGLENLDSLASADGRLHMMEDESSIFHYGLDVEICIWIFDNFWEGDEKLSLIHMNFVPGAIDVQLRVCKRKGTLYFIYVS